VSVAASQVKAELLHSMPHRSNGQRESFERALVREYPGMTLMLLRHARDAQLAADILQDAIVTTLAKLDQGTVFPTPKIAGFIFHTALYHLRNHYRRELWRSNGSAPMQEPVSNIASLEDQSQRDANARTVRRVLHGLGSSQDREVLVRFYLDEQSKQEICAALGLAEPDFNLVIFRARERMRRQLEGAGMRRADLLSLLTMVSLLALVR
jgi:RNA polymerase sigma-70 factor, ECF subfamily